ncbi:hypothetical protein ACH5RR_005187 [Cinchona calisaya]|uniref:Nudix hydrolase domain-containing protein n=1 Tax=Cinchona calisaya TaxID=153742 RepID=A0ABD3AKN7_9GENT
MDTIPPTNSEQMINVFEKHEYLQGIFQGLMREQQLQFTKPPDQPPSPSIVSDKNAEGHDHCKCSDLVDVTKESYSDMANNKFGMSRLISSRKKRAAVLICIFEGLDGELRVILTKRSMNLSTHPGEVALPGGKMDELDEDDTATALREAMEEIGLCPNLVQVVANLQPFVSSHLLTVVPVVGLLTRVEDFKPVLNADEVDAIFDVPLEMFLKEEGYRYLERQWEGYKYVCHLFDFKSTSETEQAGNYLIGGLTASILIRAASIIYQRSPSFAQLLPDFTQLHQSLNHTVLM